MTRLDHRPSVVTAEIVTASGAGQDIAEKTSTNTVLSATLTPS
jgi:hypothetical protein